MNASLKDWAGKYGDRIKYISGGAKNRLGLGAALIRPDGIISWASDGDPDYKELQEAAAHWFISDSIIGIKKRQKITAAPTQEGNRQT